MSGSGRNLGPVHFTDFILGTAAQTEHSSPYPAERFVEFSFQIFEIGKGSAIATMMLIFVTLVGGVYVHFSRQDDVA